MSGLLFFRKAISRSGLQHLGPPQPSLPPASNGPNKELRAGVDWTVRHAHTLILYNSIRIMIRFLYQYLFKYCTKREVFQPPLYLFSLAESLNDIWSLMPTDFLADWFQQPYVHVEMKNSNFLLGFWSLLENVLITDHEKERFMCQDFMGWDFFWVFAECYGFQFRNASQS